MDWKLNFATIFSPGNVRPRCIIYLGKLSYGEAVPLAPRALAFTGLTARHDSGLRRDSNALHRLAYAIEDRTIKAPQSAIFDLFLKYIWQTL